ncbi:hypothetical protein RN607_00190 [Demequina capsici]|uniref:Inner membrane protein n=1 Tax=Demequina capsici TaxID=3075620 RepID=A0AA96F6V1_9MICO|nr:MULTISPECIES: hypothetical protein [unclassified Demequina]WNM24607.1 hypothetical protein RN606_00205 [Demequina sp. OYTSA14]WNM27456.1 hypothetical protein RN607_00190 [Demequina sp. PMTSA13]
MDAMYEVFGWIGSILIVMSLMQARMLVFRWMNLIGSLIATGYNLIYGIWPYVAMNVAIVVINAYWLNRLYKEARDPHVYQVLPMPADGRFLQHVLHVYQEDIARFAPAFTVDPAAGTTRHSFMVVRGDEAVGVVAVREAGDGVGEVELDWVKPRFRNFTPGQFVYQDSRALHDAGFRQLRLTPHEMTDREYLRKAGFRTERTEWVRDLTA